MTPFLIQSLTDTRPSGAKPPETAAASKRASKTEGHDDFENAIQAEKRAHNSATEESSSARNHAQNSSKSESKADKDPTSADAKTDDKTETRVSPADVDQRSVSDEQPRVRRVTIPELRSRPKAEGTNDQVVASSDSEYVFAAESESVPERKVEASASADVTGETNDAHKLVKQQPAPAEALLEPSEGAPEKTVEQAAGAQEEVVTAAKTDTHLPANTKLVAYQKFDPQNVQASSTVKAMSGNGAVETETAGLRPGEDAEADLVIADEAKLERSARPGQEAILAASSVKRSGRQEIGKDTRAELETAALRDRMKDRATQAIERTSSSPTNRTAPPVNATASATPAAEIAAGQAAVKLQAADAKGEPVLNGEGEVETLRFDARSSVSTTTSTQQVARPEMARNIAAQISEFARAMPDKPVDVSLNPEELGRVRLSIKAGEGGVVLQVLAERPETLDLMRRNADILARELADLGFESIDLAFGQGQAQGGEGETAQDGSQFTSSARGTNDGLDETSIETTQVTQHLSLNGDGGLDIRI